MSTMLTGLSEMGFPTQIFSIHQANDGPLGEFPRGTNVQYFQDANWGSFRHSAQLWQMASSVDTGLIHSHGLWTDVHRLAATIARRKRVPHLVGPCGMLEQGALKRSWWKKRLALLWFQKRALDEASCLLANSEQEYADIRRFNLSNPVAIVPNPILGPDSIESLDCKEFNSKFPFFLEKKIVLFLGRLHPVKGLVRLVEAWGQLSAFHPEWHLVLAGPNEGGYQGVVEAQIQKMECCGSVHLIGQLDDRWKWAVLRASSLFVMPSDFENFGMSIAEAMLAGKPVVTTTGTPWKVLNDVHAGWQVERNSNSLVQALTEGMSLSEVELQEMGQRGQAIAAQFSPEKVARHLIALYKWLLNLGDCPEFVRFN